MSFHRTSKQAGFTLVEIMIVVAIIGMLAALALPVIVKARKQSQGRRIINDARQLDNAIDRWAITSNQPDGATVDTTEASTYLKTAWYSNDVLGNPYVISGVGSNQLKISGTTKTALTGVGIDWGSY